MDDEMSTYELKCAAQRAVESRYDAREAFEITSWSHAVARAERNAEHGNPSELANWRERFKRIIAGEELRGD